jgi:hypothetical protein
LVYKLILHTFDKAKYPELLKYCEAASKRDPSFKYTVLPDRIIIENPNRNIAYRRGVRIASLFKCFFEVQYVKEE